MVKFNLLEVRTLRSKGAQKLKGTVAHVVLPSSGLGPWQSVLPDTDTHIHLTGSNHPEQVMCGRIIFVHMACFRALKL